MSNSLKNCWLVAPVVVVLALGAALADLTGSVHAANAMMPSAQPPGSPGLTLPIPAAPIPTRPNIVFILTDDLSMDLLPYMPNVQAMERNGLSFTNYFVSDSLCCPSRSSIFTGNFPHDTRVFSNTGADGGFLQFHNRGEEQHTFALALNNAGYRTAMMGKYLNGYLDLPSWTGIPNTYVPPGWSEWDVAGWGYNEFNYNLNENGAIYHFGNQPGNYLTDVLAGRGVNFIDSSARARAPFFLELATFAPHFPYVPNPMDSGSFQGLRAPQPPNFDRLPTNPPRWLAAHGALSGAQIATINDAFRRRVQAVQAVDRMLGQIESTLIANGVAQNTYIVFSSDNGLHTGQYRLMPGKLTAFDTDIRVPLIVVGPGVPTGVTTTAMAENVDLAETFAAIGGTQLSGDGQSLLPLFSGGIIPTGWRDAVLVEHHGADLRGVDPDFQQPASGNPRTYEAMRTDSYLYVEYNNGEREFYNLQSDPFELHNLAGQLSARILLQLHAALIAIQNCHDAQACLAAQSSYLLRLPAQASASRGGRPGERRRPGA